MLGILVLCCLVAMPNNEHLNSLSNLGNGRESNQQDDNSVLELISMLGPDSKSALQAFSESRLRTSELNQLASKIPSSVTAKTLNLVAKYRALKNSPNPSQTELQKVRTEIANQIPPEVKALCNEGCKARVKGYLGIR